MSAELHDFPLFRGLSGSLARELGELGTPLELGDGVRLTLEGARPKTLVLLVSGRARASRADLGAGDERVVADLGPGDLVGDLWEPASSTVAMSGPGSGLGFAAPSLAKLAAREPELRLALARGVHAARRRLRERLRALLVLDAEGRLAHFLLDAAARWGRDGEGGTTVESEFKHAEIAAAIGATRETVTVLFGKLRRAGAVDASKRRIVLRDPAAVLRALVG